MGLGEELIDELPAASKELKPDALMKVHRSAVLVIVPDPVQDQNSPMIHHDMDAGRGRE